MTKENIIINIIGKTAYETAQKMKDDVCYYDETILIGEALENGGKCLWCFCKCCPIVKDRKHHH